MTNAQFSERDVEQIIARAIELDVPGRAMSLARLREIADELNISPEALNQALSERSVARAMPPAGALPAVGMSATSDTTRADLSPTTEEPRPWRQWLTAASVAAGTLTGAVAGGAVGQGGGVTEFSIMASCAAATALLWAHRKSRNGWEMSAQMLALWGSCTYAFLVAQGRRAPTMGADDVFLVGVSGLLGSLVVGNAVLFLVRFWNTRADRRARRAALRAAKAERVAAKAVQTAQRALAAASDVARGQSVHTVTPSRTKKAGVRGWISRLTGSFHTPNPSH